MAISVDRRTSLRALATCTAMLAVGCKSQRDSATNGAGDSMINAGRSGQAAIGVAVGRVTNGRLPGPEYERLNVFVGRWITEGHTVPGGAGPALKITSSDVYEWAPGGFFILHTAYGRIGDGAGGGIEIIGYDPDRKSYRTQFFDSQGNTVSEELSFRDGLWHWSGARVRCTGVFSEEGRVLTAHHERSDDGVTWTPSMEVTLTRI
jgi:Protein of unknown function (DUF1579)